MKSSYMYRKLFLKLRLNLLLAGCVLTFGATAQMDKQLALAEKYYQAGEYYTAAGLYEQFLNPVNKNTGAGIVPLLSKRHITGGTGGTLTRLDVLFRQAESYRLSFYLAQAATRYKECYEKDPGKYAAALYWYGVCQRSLGAYAAADSSINAFLTQHGATSPLKQAAEKELATLSFIKAQFQRPDTIMYKVEKANAEFGAVQGVFAPVSVGAGRYLVTSTQTDTTAPSGRNPYRNRLFYATRSNGTLQQLEPAWPEAAATAINQGAASISPDGQTLYFTQWTKENGKTQAAIWYARKSASGWEAPRILPVVNVTGYQSKQPFVNASGTYLYFASDRPGGQGKFDIWFAPLQADGTTGQPVNAGSVINTADDEQAPFYHEQSGTLVFSSDGRTGMGGFDLFASEGIIGAWQTPENMGYPVNSPRDDIYFHAPQQTDLLKDGLVSSDRGSNCCLETYSVQKEPKRRLVLGTVIDCNDSLPMKGAEVTLKGPDGEEQRTITDEQGRYRFVVVGDVWKQQLSIRKEYYRERDTALVVRRTSEVNPLVDTLFSQEICVDKRVVIKPEEVVILYFDFDKSIIKPRGKELLDSVYNVLINTPGASVQISGHTDGLGTEEYNLKLGERRAKACADYLIAKGLDPERVSVMSFGKCCPAEMELINGIDNAEGRSKNRRALVNITKPE
jgi:outer membrane protein OmpA-like peptidoglycan-associated protein